MIPEHLDALAAAEEKHWWFVGRRQVIARIIATLSLATRARIFDIGCGPGGNLAMLAGFGDVSACELDDRVRALAVGRGFRVVAGGELPQELPFGDEQFDLVTMLDVLEHTSDDLAALQRVRARIGPGGWVLITVPAFQWLWSAHDDGSRHFRRYTRARLMAVLTQAGFAEVRAGYFNFWLFPLAIIAKGLNRRPGKKVPGLAVPPGWINALFTFLLGSEAAGAARQRWPWGVSVIAWARARPSPSGSS